MVVDVTEANGALIRSVFPGESVFDGDIGLKDISEFPMGFFNLMGFQRRVSRIFGEKPQGLPGGLLNLPRQGLQFLFERKGNDQLKGHQRVFR